MRLYSFIDSDSALTGRSRFLEKHGEGRVTTFIQRIVKLAKRRHEDPWSTELPRTLFTRDGQEIRTLADAGAYMLDLPDDIALHPSWKHAARLVMDAAQGGDVTAATNQIALALLVGLRLDVRRTQPPEM